MRSSSTGSTVPKHLLYLIGQPGSGKSTLAAALTGDLPSEVWPKPFAHTIWIAPGARVLELGVRRETFSGTDTLGMSVQPLAVEWIGRCGCDFVLAEGDRLANDGFFNAALAAGYSLRLLRLMVSSEVAAHRRAARAHALGTKLQNDGWLKGRVSKVRNLAVRWDGLLEEIDADQSPERVLAAALAVGGPVATLLRSPGE